jgi:SAM-dependent methyltransferase
MTTAVSTPPMPVMQAHTDTYANDYVAEYANRVLRPAEVMILVRYREALSGRVLEIGCGAGRVLGYLQTLGGEVHGIDISPEMIKQCRGAYPGVDARVGDMRDLAATLDGHFTAIFASYNVLDVLDDEGRRWTIGQIRTLLSQDSLLLFSSHNLAHLSRGRGRGSGGRRRAAGRVLARLDRPPSSLVNIATHLPKRLRNRRHLSPRQRTGPGYAIVNDEAFDYGLLHYYIGRDEQERQLDELGFDLIECLDAEGRTVPAGQHGLGPDLHYVARPR